MFKKHGLFFLLIFGIKSATIDRNLLSPQANSIMKFHIATFFKIPLYIHWTNVAFVPYFLFFSDSIGLLVATFIFITLHEYGHCLMAKYFVIDVRGITIYPIGGVAIIKFPIYHPKEEFLITLAGPYVNFLLIIVFGTIKYFFNSINTSLSVALYVNIVILMFNLIPAFPLDGGRLLRAVLVILTKNYQTVTFYVVRFSQAICIVMFFLGFYLGYVWLSVIFLLIFVASQNELVEVRHCMAIHSIKWKIGLLLKKPELITAPIAEVITAVESVSDTELLKSLRVKELMPILREVEQRAS